MTNTSILDRPLSDRKLRIVILAIIMLIIIIQWAWIATLSELYELMSGGSVGLREKDVRNKLGAPVDVAHDSVPHLPGFYPIPSQKAEHQGKILIYKRFRYCAYIYISKSDRVTANFIAHRF